MGRQRGIGAGVPGQDGGGEGAHFEESWVL
jgi:hypothetical protein